MPTTKCKIEFSNVLQSFCTAKSKNKSDTFTFSRNIALILHSKVVFKKLFWLKLLVLKNTLHARNPLIPQQNFRHT